MKSTLKVDKLHYILMTFNSIEDTTEKAQFKNIFYNFYAFYSLGKNMHK